jgi:hypothetical protein
MLSGMKSSFILPESSRMKKMFGGMTLANPETRGAFARSFCPAHVFVVPNTVMIIHTPRRVRR